MAVTRNPDEHQSATIEQEVEVGGNAIRREPKRVESLDGNSNLHPLCGAHCDDRHQRRRRKDEINKILDIEVLGYLHNKEEMRLKKIIWEAMNEGHGKFRGMQRKRGRESKKDTSGKKVAKTSVGVESKKVLSSRIDYDALNNFMNADEPKEAPGDARAGLNNGVQSDKLSAEVDECDEDNWNKDGQEGECEEDADPEGDWDGSTHCGYEYNYDYEDYDDE